MKKYGEIVSVMAFVGLLCSCQNQEPDGFNPKLLVAKREVNVYQGKRGEDAHEVLFVLQKGDVCAISELGWQAKNGYYFFVVCSNKKHGVVWKNSNYFEIIDKENILQGK